MGLKSMHAEKQSEQPQQSVQDNSLIEQQSQKIEELEKLVSSLQSQNEKTEEQKRIHITEVLNLRKTLQKKDLQASEAISQAEEWKNQAEKSEIQIQKLLSDKQELVSTVAEQGKRIAEQTEQIEKLNEADNVLKQNGELKLQNKKLQEEKQSVLKKAEAEVLNFKNEYAKKEKEIERIREEAEKELIRAVKARNNQEEIVKERVDEKYMELKKSLENKVDGTILAIKGAFIASIIYGLVCTLFTGMHSERFVIDFKEFFISLKGFILFCTEKLLKTANMASQIGNMIPEAVSSFIVKWLVWLVAVAGLIIGLIALIFILTKTVIKTYKKICEEYKDFNKMNLSIMLFTLSASVYFAEQIRGLIPLNLLWLILLSPILFWAGFVIISITIALIKDSRE